MGQKNHDTEDSKTQQTSGHTEKKPKKSSQGRPDNGGTAGQSGGEQANNRSSNPDSIG